MDRKGVKLSIKGLSVSYEKTLVLDRIGLRATDGEFVAIVGESGCGKTTLLGAIAGFLDFDGRITAPKRIGVVFQDHAVFPWLTVAGNIRFGLKEKSKTLDYYLKMTGIEDKKDRYPFQLSGGEAQRVALARTLAADLDLILMDEPYGSLDIYTRERMQRWLLDVWEKEKKTVLMVTHSIDEAILLADRVLVMRDKKIVAEFKVPFKRPRDWKIKFEKRFVDLTQDISTAISDWASRPVSRES